MYWNKCFAIKNSGGDDDDAGPTRRICYSRCLISILLLKFGINALNLVFQIFGKDTHIANDVSARGQRPSS